ncbi:hypothetical protein AtNW77_Chr5g0092071 [Arabidopsis thaliana]|jgi:hypothetical protein|uniref:At5g08400/F8L15_130 n=1 Tax=Arabidopsis thaliana TaxID=3702 RepID=Q8VZD1_ARATH|nr:structural maintenance of chromosomes-like protein, putative (DUF3531) [Arabidopsis thaliana]AAL57685.1 unknown protein [Arabidopsis thaliana]AAN64516.1 At5g08400/F8L15_130 [Arabidopsis thaliana]AED91295.1 structural maintenance of chromosomes-like protein, putative (DUF3531) [Arabidopsis thaliana]|eukprot:NP_196457.2 structural maintenance of chromosomes-like protein, putative (DUF3531) [Arabidopsis thaliana]
MYENNLLTLSSCTMNLNFAFSPFLVSQRQPFSSHKRNLHTLVAVSANSDNLAGEDNGGISAANKGSGTTARGRRLLKVREEKRKRDYDRLHDYPSWAKYLFLSFSFALQVFVFLPKSRESVNLFLVNDKCRVLESACKDDEELRAVLGDSIGNPELMRKKVEERVRKKGKDFQKQKTGSVLSFKVNFRDFNPVDSFIWFELYGTPSDRDVDLIGSVIQAWYVMGRLGAFNTSNLQLANTSLEYDPLYDAEKGFKVMPSSFHDISDVEFQDNWGRVWVDLGTSDIFALDVLLNCLTVMSSEYLGIQQVVFGGKRMGDWEEGMTNPDFGYKYFKI